MPINIQWKDYWDYTNCSRLVIGYSLNYLHNINYLSFALKLFEKWLKAFKINNSQLKSS